MIPDAMEIQPKCRTGILDSIENRPDPCPETFVLVVRLTVATTPGFDRRFFVIERNEEDNPWLLNGVLRVRGHLIFTKAISRSRQCHARSAPTTSPLTTGAESTEVRQPSYPCIDSRRVNYMFVSGSPMLRSQSKAREFGRKVRRSTCSELTG